MLRSPSCHAATLSSGSGVPTMRRVVQLMISLFVVLQGVRNFALCFVLSHCSESQTLEAGDMTFMQNVVELGGWTPVHK